MVAPRGDHTPRGRVGPNVAKFLAEENERQRRFLATQAEQFKHMSQRALSARREADVAEVEREQAHKDLEAAQRDASDAL